MTLIRLLANLGYGSRSEVQRMLRQGRVTTDTGRVLRLRDDDPGGELRVDDRPLDPRAPLLLALHKPAGFVCTRALDEGATVYDLLPPRFAARQPVLAPVGRLDKDTTGLLLLTDDGQLLHRLTSPRHHVPRSYLADLAQPPAAGDVEQLAQGSLQLRGDQRPLAPAQVELLAPTQVRVTVTEGRYHLVRRMWGALGNRVTDLHRDRFGSLALGTGALRDLEPGAWCALSADLLDSDRAPG